MLKNALEAIKTRLTPAKAWVIDHQDPLNKWGFDAAAILTPVILFLCFFNPYVLDPTRIGWLMTHDWGQHVLGWNAFRHVPWDWAFYYQNLLAYPTGLSIIYTDSNPPLAYLFKILGPLLPQNFQYIGPWFFLCVCLQVYVGYRLIRPYAPNNWTALGGAIILSVLPALYYRMRHDTLMAHFLILWSLHIFLNIKDEKEKVKYHALNNFITGAIHPYILVMTAAIWGADVIRQFWPAFKRRDMPAILFIARDAFLVLLAPLVSMGLVGTYAAGQSAGAGGFGFYSMGLDALINPVEPEFSNIMKAWYQDSGQAFEGYQYLGFGLLVLLALAGFYWWQRKEVRVTGAFFKRLWPLWLPMLCLFILSLSNHIQVFNMTVLKVQLPPKLMEILAILRASGRFFWPISYLLIIGALVVVLTLPKRMIAATFAIVLGLQAIDLAGFAYEMRYATRYAASPTLYRLTPDKRWDVLMDGAKGVRVYPAQVHFNQKLFYELAWRSTSRAIPINTMYAARENTTQIAIEQAEQDRFLRGELKADHLYVFLKQCYAPRELQSKLRELDGVWIIPPEALKDMDLKHPTWQPIAPIIRFGWLNQGACLLDDNWSRPTSDGVWSQADSVSLNLPMRHIQMPVERPRAFQMDIGIEARKPITVTLIVNRRKIETLKLVPSQSTYTVTLPRAFLNAENLRVTFEIDDPDDKDAPGDDNIRNDPRRQLPQPQVSAQTPSFKLRKLELIGTTGR